MCEETINIEDKKLTKEEIILNMCKKSLFERFEEKMSADLEYNFVPKDKDVREIQKVKKEVILAAKELKRTDEILPFINLINIFLWKLEARILINKNICDEDKLTSMIENAPKDTKKVQEYINLEKKLRVRGQYVVEEKAIYGKVLEF